MITPPPALVEEWQRTAPNLINKREHYHYITLCAAQWGADQELEACCEWIPEFCPWDAAQLRAARRPKPPSLKEQALEALGPEPLPETGPTGDTILNHGVIERHRLVRKALEALPND